MVHTKMWTDMFVLTLPLAEKILRPVLVYLVLIAGLRLSGKRELAQLNPFDLVGLLTLSNTVQNAIIGDDSTVTGGVIGAIALLTLNYLVVRFLFRYPKLERLVVGDEAVLIHQGKLQRSRLNKERLTTEELEAAARRQGFPNLKEVQEAVLGPSGIITFTSRHPDEAHVNHRELMERIEQLSQQIATLRPVPPPPAA